MIKIKTAVLLLTSWVTLQPCVLRAQLAKQSGMTAKQLNSSLNMLFQKEEPGDKQLLKELEAAAESNNEEFVNLAIRTYNGLSRRDLANTYEEQILTRFPRGIKAREAALNKLFSAENGASAEQIEKEYRNWLTMYPAANFSEDNQYAYARANNEMIILYLREKQFDKMEVFMQECKKLPQGYSYSIRTIEELLKIGKTQRAISFQQEAYDAARREFDPKDIPMLRYALYPRMASNFAKNLVRTDDPKRALHILEDYFSLNTKANENPQDLLLLANLYHQMGRTQEAFTRIDQYLVGMHKEPEILELSKKLFVELYGNKKSYEEYLETTNARYRDLVRSKSEGKMLKKKAIPFTLLDRSGNSISLSDFKGKVVVLDFWATWCGPCKASFPGMQRAVDKYKNDTEVVFLFIDVFERDSNYKETVDRFMKETGYTFHVLFDEMTERGSKTMDAYKVTGIPYKVIIDKNGDICFETVGSTNDADKIVDELSVKIELARKR